MICWVTTGTQLDLGKRIIKCDFRTTYATNSNLVEIRIKLMGYNSELAALVADPEMKFSLRHFLGCGTKSFLSDKKKNLSVFVNFFETEFDCKDSQIRFNRYASIGLYTILK